MNGSAVQDFKARGASVHGVSYEDESELVEVLKGADVVLSTLNAGGITGAQVITLVLGRRLFSHIPG